jgi:hypothetical protein
LAVLDPSNLRVGIAGNILELAGPKKVLAEKFLSFKVSHAPLLDRTLITGIQTLEPYFPIFGNII